MCPSSPKNWPPISGAIQTGCKLRFHLIPETRWRRREGFASATARHQHSDSRDRGPSEVRARFEQGSWESGGSTLTNKGEVVFDSGKAIAINPPRPGFYSWRNRSIFSYAFLLQNTRLPKQPWRIACQLRERGVHLALRSFAAGHQINTRRLT